MKQRQGFKKLSMLNYNIIEMAKHIVFSTDRLPKLLLESAKLLLEHQQLQKEMIAFETPQVHLHERQKLLNDKVNSWIANNIVESG